MKTVLALLVMFLLMAPASADSKVIFSQSPVNHVLSRTSDWSNENQKADDFALAGSAQTVTRIRWWGSYGADPDPAVDSFVFKFFTEDPGNSDYPDIWCFADGTRYPRSSEAVDFARTATAMISDSSSTHDGGTVYEYSAILDTPIHLEAGKRYWIAITNSTPAYTYPPTTNSKWGWLESNGGSHWYRMGHCPLCADDWTVSNTKNLAFALETFPQVGLSNRAASDPIISAASTRFLFTVWGKSKITSDRSLQIDDGTGAPITVQCSGVTGVADGDYVRATGLLSYSANGSALSADTADVGKIR